MKKDLNCQCQGRRLNYNIQYSTGFYVSIKGFAIEEYRLLIDFD